MLGGCCAGSAAALGEGVGKMGAGIQAGNSIKQAYCLSIAVGAFCNSFSERPLCKANSAIDLQRLEGAFCGKPLRFASGAQCPAKPKLNRKKQNVAADAY